MTGPVASVRLIEVLGSCAGAVSSEGLGRPDKKLAREPGLKESRLTCCKKRTQETVG